MQSDRLLKMLGEFDASLVLTHDNPDPDAIAAGWALVTMVRARLKRGARLLADAAGEGPSPRCGAGSMMRVKRPDS